MMPMQQPPQMQQQGQPPSMFGGQIPPQLMQMLMQQMQQGQGQQQNPNPLASMMANPGGATGPQGAMQGQGDQNGSAGGGNGMGGLMQIINALKAQQTVNGTDPQGGPDIMKLLAMLKGA